MALLVEVIKLFTRPPAAHLDCLTKFGTGAASLKESPVSLKQDISVDVLLGILICCLPLSGEHFGSTFDFSDKKKKLLLLSKTCFCFHFLQSLPPELLVNPFVQFCHCSGKKSL